MGEHRILILSASAGSGHLRAADALEQVCRSHPEFGEVKNVDALTYTNKLFRDFYSKFYIKLVKDAPTFLGWWYDATDEPWKTDRMRLMLDRLNTQPLVRLIEKFQPKETICTHFLPAEIISYLMSRERIQTNLSIVVTDLDFHAMWLSRIFHRYFVALDETKVHLKMLGLPEDRITVSGIPIDPRFQQLPPRAQVREKHGLRQNHPVLLVSAGALSVGPAELVVKVLRGLETPAQVVVICGKNEDLQNRVREQAEQIRSEKVSFRILGFTHEIHDWMAAADLYIGKPGGLTTAEAMAAGLPMVIFSPIPGQEERNSDHLLEKGAAIKCNEVTIIAYKIDRLLQNPERLQAMREAARRLGKPQAAQTVIDTLLHDFTSEPVQMDRATRLHMVEAARKR